MYTPEKACANNWLKKARHQCCMEFCQVCSMPFHFRSTSHSIWKETKNPRTHITEKHRSLLFMQFQTLQGHLYTGDVSSDCILVLSHAVVSASSAHSSTIDLSPPGQCGTAGRTLAPESTGQGCSVWLLHLANINLCGLHNHRSESWDETLGR